MARNHDKLSAHTARRRIPRCLPPSPRSNQDNTKMAEDHQQSMKAPKVFFNKLKPLFKKPFTSKSGSRTMPGPCPLCLSTFRSLPGLPHLCLLPLSLLLSYCLKLFLYPPAAVSVNLEEVAKLRAKYTRFRILVIGRANAGKTTLLKRVCNTTDEPSIYDEGRNLVSFLTL